MITTTEVNEFTGRLAELIKQVQGGNEILLMQGHKPVAKIISTSEKEVVYSAKVQFHSLTGHRVLTPVISQSEPAEEMFPTQ